jgi:uncharacterized protein (TIGR02266 family)
MSQVSPFLLSGSGSLPIAQSSPTLPLSATTRSTSPTPASHRPLSSGISRQQPRAGLSVEVGLETESTFYTGWSGNLSDGGIFVATHLVQAIGSRVELTFALPGDDELIRATGAVRWVREFQEANDVPPGMGIRLEPLSDKDMDRIHRFVAARPPLFFDDDLP